MTVSAYNICVLTAKDRINEALTWSRKAADLRPEEPRYAFTPGFLPEPEGRQRVGGQCAQRFDRKYPAYADAYLLLGGIYEEQGKKSEAREMVGNAFGVEGIPDQVKQRIGA